MVIRTVIMLFGFWIVFGIQFLIVDMILERMGIREKRQETIQGALFLVLFFLWWAVLYLRYAF